MDRLVQMAGLGRTALRVLASRKRSHVVAQLNRHAEWYLSDRIPSKYPRDVLPGLGSVKVNVDVDVGHPFELPCGERTVLAAILAHVSARLVVEIGTFSGTTTRLMADACAGTVHTLDLPPGLNVFDPDIIEQVGRAFRDDPAYAGRIVQHFGDSRTFDFSMWHDKADVVFVDGSHERDDVLADCATAMRLARPGGVIVWDDYQPTIPGVVAALHEFGRSVELVHIAGTRLVLHHKTKTAAHT